MFVVEEHFDDFAGWIGSADIGILDRQIGISTGNNLKPLIKDFECSLIGSK